MKFLRLKEGKTANIQQGYGFELTYNVVLPDFVLKDNIRLCIHMFPGDYMIVNTTTDNWDMFYMSKEDVETNYEITDYIQHNKESSCDVSVGGYTEETKKYFDDLNTEASSKNKLDQEMKQANELADRLAQLEAEKTYIEQFKKKKNEEEDDEILLTGGWV